MREASSQHEEIGKSFPARCMAVARPAHGCRTSGAKALHGVCNGHAPNTGQPTCRLIKGLSENKTAVGSSCKARQKPRHGQEAAITALCRHSTTNGPGMKKGGNDSTAIIATQYLSILFLLNRKRSGHHAL